MLGTCELLNCRLLAIGPLTECALNPNRRWVVTPITFTPPSCSWLLMIFSPASSKTPSGTLKTGYWEACSGSAPAWLLHDLWPSAVESYHEALAGSQEVKICWDTVALLHSPTHHCFPQATKAEFSSSDSDRLKKWEIFVGHIGQFLVCDSSCPDLWFHMDWATGSTRGE